MHKRILYFNVIFKHTFSSSINSAFWFVCVKLIWRKKKELYEKRTENKNEYINLWNISKNLTSNSVKIKTSFKQNHSHQYMYIRWIDYVNRRTFEISEFQCIIDWSSSSLNMMKQLNWWNSPPKSRYWFSITISPARNSIACPFTYINIF